MGFGQLLDDLIPSSGGLLVIRAILALILVFILPGFAWTLVFFNKISRIERAALSFGLSIAAVTLSILVLNVLFGMRINGVNALLTIFVITVIPLAIYFVRRYLTRQSKAANGD